MQGGYGGGYGGGAPGGGGGWGPPPGGAPPGGGYGAPPGGGGFGQAPGGPPPGGGYGAPPGGGFGGGPPGGGFGGAPPGGGFGGPNPYGAPGGPGMGPQQTGAGRFFKHAAIGGVISGVLGAIPLVSALNCCFCLLTQIGAIIAVNMYLKENPQEQLSGGEGATCGAVTGVVSGVVGGILGIIVNLIFGGANAAMLKQLPPDVARNMGPLLAGGVAAGLIMLVVGTAIQAGFGAIGGVLGMSLFFKDRRRA